VAARVEACCAGPELLDGDEQKSELEKEPGQKGHIKTMIRISATRVIANDSDPILKAESHNRK
jgi:hypothetical protein